MPITPAFTVSQSGLSPSVVTLTDSSTGSDANVTQRRVYFQTSQGTYLVPSGTSTDYATWSYADASSSFSILNGEDYALSVTVQWLDVSNTVLYSLTQLFCFPQYNKNFFYYLLQNQALTPSIYQDTNYANNLALYWINIIGAIQAIEIGADVAASQNCLNRATLMMTNEAKYF
jgi:hypothetical protein